MIRLLVISLVALLAAVPTMAALSLYIAPRIERSEPARATFANESDTATD